MDKNKQQLVDECISGSSSAKELIYIEYAPVLYGICLRYINNRMEAEDVLHESFITIFGNISQLKNQNALEGWMKRIAVNNSLKHLNNKKYDSDIDDLNAKLTDIETNETPDIKEKILQNDISQDDMLSVISNLPAGYKMVFNLFVFEKLKHSEIAEQLNISVSTSKSQLLRARKLIQKQLYKLVSTKEKEKKREYVLLTSFLGIMEDDLEYIDQLAHKKLSQLRTQPKLDASKILNKTNTSSWVTKAKLALSTSQKALWYIGISSTATIAIAFIIFISSTSKQIDKTQYNINTSVINKTDSLLKTSKVYIDSSNTTFVDSNTTITNSDTIAWNTKSIISKKVYVKKVVKIKKRKVINDTIRKTDTLHLH